jgi:hypothetical protein
MSRDEFFNNLFNEATPAAEDIKALRQLAYEERVIKRVFTECCIRPQSWGRIANQSRELTGANKINFCWFNTAYGASFPAKLCGKRIPYLYQLRLADIYKPVKQNRLVKAVLKALAVLEINPAKESFLLVFPLIKTPFCAHSIRGAGYDDPAEGDTRGQLLFRVSGMRPLFIEPLKTACRAIGSEWYTT